MRKAYKFIIVIIILLTIGLLWYSYSNVYGSQIDGVVKISTSSTVTVTKRNIAGDISGEYVLNGQQIEKLKELIIKTNFRKAPSSVRYYDKEHYEIVAKDSDQDLWLSMHSLGGEYISLANQFSGKHLKIKNPDWKKTIEEILYLSK